MAREPGCERKPRTDERADTDPPPADRMLRRRVPADDQPHQRVRQREEREACQRDLAVAGVEHVAQHGGVEHLGERQPGRVHTFERQAQERGDDGSDPTRPDEQAGAPVVTPARPHREQEEHAADEHGERRVERRAVDAVHHADGGAPSRGRQQRGRRALRALLAQRRLRPDLERVRAFDRMRVG
jgi:hypothetical protein